MSVQAPCQAPSVQRNAETSPLLSLKCSLATSEVRAIVVGFAPPAEGLHAKSTCSDRSLKPVAQC